METIVLPTAWHEEALMQAVYMNFHICEELMSALSADPRTARAHIEVVFDGGVVTLLGEVDNYQIHTAAEEVVHRHPRVVSVVNALEVRARPWVDEIDYSVGTILGQRVL